ncbi:MAG: phage holin family protein [Patescibacteria group bacterium]
MRGPVSRFLVRWFVSSLGLWIAAGLFSNITYEREPGVITIAGLILALVNTVIKPIVVILSLPAILFSLGLFMIVVNGLMVLLVSWLYEPLQVSSFTSAILAGMVIGLVNYLVTTILDDRKR